MTTGEQILRHFDIVNHVLINYRIRMITEIAEKYNIPLLELYQVYDALGIDPLEVVLKNLKTNGHIQQYIQIKPSDKEPNRTPNKTANRPQPQYSNTSPFGFAKLLHENKDLDNPEENAGSKKDI